MRLAAAARLDRARREVFELVVPDKFEKILSFLTTFGISQTRICFFPELSEVYHEIEFALSIPNGTLVGIQSLLDPMIKASFIGPVGMSFEDIWLSNARKKDEKRKEAKETAAREAKARAQAKKAPAKSPATAEPMASYVIV